LTAGHLSMGGTTKVSRFIEAIAKQKEEPVLFHNLILAANCINDVGEARVEAVVREDIQKRLSSGIGAKRKWRLLGKNTPDEIKEWIKQRSIAMEALVESGWGFWKEPYREPEWIDIPAGSFEMSGESEYDGKPTHTVSLPAFKISKVPITNAQYRLFVDQTKHTSPQHWEDGTIPSGLESHPVVNVSWHDALAYCNWLSGRTGQTITLPSEAEWEKAAGWDPKKRYKRMYPWGDQFDQFKLNCDDLGIGTTTPVGIFQEGASPYGVLDMSGNVWEWTRSHYKDYPYKVEDGREDLTAGDDVRRTLRGGSFIVNHDANFRVAYRSYRLPYYRIRDSGFRVVCVSSPISS
jgi:formylglycine-generating enzyme required for sulfatase activity